MVWKPGQSGNPHGRPRKNGDDAVPDIRAHFRDKQRVQLRLSAQEQGLPDPLLFQHQKLLDESIPVPIRCAIACNIAPYYHPKLGISSPPKFIETIIEVPQFTTIDEAEVWLAKLPVLVW